MHLLPAAGLATDNVSGNGANDDDPRSQSISIAVFTLVLTPVCGAPGICKASEKDMVTTLGAAHIALAN